MKQKDEIVRDMKRLGYLWGDDEIILAQDFLWKVVDNCEGYFKRISVAIDAKKTAALTSAATCDVNVT